MPLTGGLPLELSAQIFATLALKADADSAFAVGSQFAVMRLGPAGAATIFLEDDLRANLDGEFPSAAIEGFWQALRTGRLHGFRYASSNGGFRTSAVEAPILFLPREEVLRRMDPLSDEMKGTRPVHPRPWVSLTHGMIHLYALGNISRDSFEEAVFRALGHRAPEVRDLLWLHAGDGHLRRSTVTKPLQLTSKPPAMDRAGMYGRNSTRFPVVTLEFRTGEWKMKEQYVYGSLPIREMVLSILVGTPWPVRFVPRPRRPYHRLPPPPKAEVKPPAAKEKRPMAERKTRMPRRTGHYPIAEFLFENEPGTSPAPGRAVAITQPDIPLELLGEIPIGIFQKAVRWALGHEPKPGDRLAFTSGPGFSKRGRLRECLVLCPTISKSRRRSCYPRVWMEYRDGRWVLLPGESEGDHAMELVRALSTRTPWGLL